MTASVAERLGVEALPSGLSSAKAFRRTEQFLLQFMREKAAARGGDIDAGVSCDAPDGTHWFAYTLRDADTAGYTLGDVVQFPLEHRALANAVSVLRMLHQSDEDCLGAQPTAEEGQFHINFGYRIAVKGGRAVGYLVVVDGDGADALHDGNYESLVNVWVARGCRRRGIARRLLEDTRREQRISELQRPFTTAGRAWITAVAPELVDPGRNDPCPCGSGSKHKRCCL